MVLTENFNKKKLSNHNEAKSTSSVSSFDLPKKSTNNSNVASNNASIKLNQPQQYEARIN